MEPIALASEERFMEVYETYADALFRHCYLRILDREAAKKLVTDAFKSAWQETTRGSVSDARLFLYRTANALISAGRAQRAELRNQETPLSADRAEQHLLECVGQLAAHERDVLVMHYVDRLSSPDIAAIIGESLQTVSQRLAEGMRFFRSLSYV